MARRTRTRSADDESLVRSWILEHPFVTIKTMVDAGSPGEFTVVLTELVGVRGAAPAYLGGGVASSWVHAAMAAIDEYERGGTG